MQLPRPKINNFRCFGSETMTIDLHELTTFIGSNSSGKTVAMVALLRLFGTLASGREIIRSNFHLAATAIPDRLIQHCHVVLMSDEKNGRR